MFGLYWDRTCLNTDLCNSLKSHGAPAQPSASVQTITLSLVKGWAVSRCTESAAPELYKEASNSTQALLHFRQSSGVCLCPLHSCLCAPQTDCWVHPCTAGGGHQVPRQLALLSSPLWLAAQLQRCDKVLYVLCLVTVCLRYVYWAWGLRASQLQRTARCVCSHSEPHSISDRHYSHAPKLNSVTSVTSHKVENLLGSARMLYYMFLPEGRYLLGL